MKPELEKIRLQLDLEAIAEREGFELEIVLKLSQENPIQYVKEWKKRHFFDKGCF